MAKDQQDTDEQADSKEPEATDKNDSEESKSQAPVDEKAVESPDKTAEQPAENEQKASDENQADAEEPVVEEVAKVEAEPDEPAEPTDGMEPATGPVSETIQRMAQSSAGSPDGADRISLALCAKDIMQEEVLWG